VCVDPVVEEVDEAVMEWIKLCWEVGKPWGDVRFVTEFTFFWFKNLFSDIQNMKNKLFQFQNLKEAKKYY